MRFPDPNIGYVCGYKSKIIDDGFLVTFLGGLVKIRFKFNDIESINKEVYNGGKVSWDVIRWGRCPNGTEALRILLRKGSFRSHIIVFDNLETAVNELKSRGLSIIQTGG
ncbi:MAG: hypothetical protein ABFD25_06690 [Clostridiaceae bacterium]